ncbi:LVIVD repeat-containing protein [Pyxidicoccus sp. MSG2]|uniref:LVIVD repeat-containing protein n=1 Tax=Pyxidicoccus sp. MSG2 TaxID=2996790 RepID=UPI00226D8327|nr:hypothetical protein [Pyxidicoccus sp. MSG2]MCY1018430.1 hypothetical protein [Pyxidicoccus sp. MSG2]
MRPSTSRALLVLAFSATLSACSSSESPPPPEPEPFVYDGPWTPLPEEGEWRDRGSFAPCSEAEAGRAIGLCNETLPPNPAACDLASLAGLETRGAVYRAEIRVETTLQKPSGPEPYYRPEEGGFRFDATGTLVSVKGLQAFSAYLDQMFYVAGYIPAGFAEPQYAFIGCRASSPRELTGCISACGNGQLRYFGSFRAQRMTWRQGEAESSGGLQLLSESFVELGKPGDVFVAKDHAYVVSYDRPGRRGGLTVFDVSDRRHPVLKTSFNIPGDSYWNGVWAKGDALYVASDARGVLVFDISSPAEPRFVRNVPGSTQDGVHTVSVDGDRLYATALRSDAMLMFDVSSPLEPRLLTRFKLPSEPRDASLGPARQTYPHDAFAYQGRLYINYLSDGFAVVDVSALPDTTLLGRYNYPYAFSHTNAVGTFNGRTIAFEGGETTGAHLRVLDVTDPAHIVKVGEYTLRDLTSIHNMVLRGTRLYVAWYHEGVRVLDVSDPSKPRELAYFNTYRESDARREDQLYEGAIGMRVPGDGYVYVVDTARGLLIFEEL